MEDPSPPIKKRKLLHEHQTEHSESDKDSNASTDVVPNDGKESLIKGSQIDHVDPEQENVERKTEIIMEESELGMSTDMKMDAVDSLTNLDETKQSGSEVKIEYNLSSKISESCVMEESELGISTESKMDTIDSLINLDETKQSGNEVKIEDNLSTKISESCAMEESELGMSTEMKMDGVDSLTNLDETKQSVSKVKIEDNLSTKISESCVMEESELGMSTESKMVAIDSLTNLDETKQSGSDVKIEDNLSTKISESCGHNSHSLSRKKLLVLDVNGLLVDIVLYPDQSYKADTFLGAKAVFKRPHCDEFLKFCFEKFDVGIWTSRTRRNIERVLEFLMKDTQQQLLFCWDQSHCTETGFNTIDNNDKPLVLKELKKLWEKEDPNLPWDKGVYDKSNTLLLDDSPYKALRNPPHTAIFPYTYTYRNTKDKGLGPNGDLRNYLEKLAASDNVQTFIKQNPFGQQPITYKNKSWKFYHKIIGPPLSKPELSRRKLIIIDSSGLLVDMASLSRDRFRGEGNKAESYRADTIQGSKAVFKRPYCDEFLKFLFERFDVGVWSSTTSFNTERVLDFLMGDNQQKLLFCWDHTRCTDTGFYTVENSSKPLVLKELRRLWEKQDPDLPWEIGEYDESNTLLVENTPYKALLNPPHTAIFPYPYRCWKTDDNSLGPTGDLRVYLERLAASENVQKFVEENPYGQRPIREKNLSWGFYQKIIRAFSSEPEATADNSSVEAHCITSSEPKTVSTTVSVTQPTLLEPKTDSTTAPNTVSSSVSVTPTLLEPKTGSATAPNTVSSSVAVTPTLLEPKTDSATAPNTVSSSVSVTPTLLEPKTDSTTASVTSILLEPKTNITTASVTPTLLQLKTDSSTALVTPPWEPKTDTTTLVTPTLLEPKNDASTALVSPTLLEPKYNASTVLVTPTLLEPKNDASTALVTPTLMEPKNYCTASVAKTCVEPVTYTAKSVLPTLLETETDSTVSVPPTSLEPKTDATTALAAPTLVKPNIDTATASDASTKYTNNASGSRPSYEIESDNKSSLEPTNDGSSGK